MTRLLRVACAFIGLTALSSCLPAHVPSPGSHSTTTTTRPRPKTTTTRPATTTTTSTTSSVSTTSSTTTTTTTIPAATLDAATKRDLLIALADEDQAYSLHSQYDASAADMQAIDPSLDWGGRLNVAVAGAVTDNDGGTVCLSEQSLSGNNFSIGKVVAGAKQGTYYGFFQCAAPTSAAIVAAMGIAWS